jgi:hypothetical protein
MGKVVLRPATRADFDAMLAEPLPWRVRATAAEVDGKLIGVGGLAFLPDGTIGAFVHAFDEARKYPVSMHRAGLKTMADARALGIRRVVALADKNIDRATPWLERLGFRKMIQEGEGVWVWQL